MSSHQKAMCLLVIRLELEELLERTDRSLGIFPFQLERRELLCRGNELAIRLFALAIDPRRREVGEKFTAMHRDRRAEVLDRLAGTSCLLGLAAAAQRSSEHLEVHVDGDRQCQAISRVGTYDARGFRRAGGCERFAQRVKGEVKVRKR